MELGSASNALPREAAAEFVEDVDAFPRRLFVLPLGDGLLESLHPEKLLVPREFRWNLSAVLLLPLPLPPRDGWECASCSRSGGCVGVVGRRGSLVEAESIR